MLLDEVTKKIELEIDELVEAENLYKNYYPHSPNTIVSVIDGGGSNPNRYTPIRDKTIEIKLRAETYPQGIELGNRIFDLFHSRENYKLGNYYITTSYALSELSYLYSDNEQRDEFSLEINFQYKNLI